MKEAMPALFRLDRPLRDEKPDTEPYEEPYKSQLEDLQGNILKSHGRGAAVHLFLTFKDCEQNRVKQFLREFKLTSAFEQLKQAEAYRNDRRPGVPFAFLCLSASGYRYLGFDKKKQFQEFSEQFRKGMKKADLDDPPPEEWEPQFQRELHAMLILADDRVEKLTELLSERRDELEKFAEIGIEFGLTMRNAQENPIEHFGYADGVSQPIFFQSDLKRTSASAQDLAGLDLVLVKDPCGGLPTACGTYFVFRKLEQNVRAFKAGERALANALKLDEDDRERAGAMVVGRFENGTPIESQGAAEEPKPGTKFTPENNFDYERDTKGNRCPLAAHIRITNPRTPEDNVHRIARRGITYGDPTPPGEDDDSEKFPRGGVGLLFQCCQRDIRKQFEYLQGLANDAADPIIGQSARCAFPDLEFPKVYNKPGRMRFNFRDRFPPFVKMKGGEYFFVPSISFFKNLM